MNHLLSNGGKGVLDVREAEEYAEAHVKGSTSFPWSKRSLHYFVLPPRTVAITVLCTSANHSKVTAEIQDKGWTIERSMCCEDVDWDLLRTGGLVESGSHSEFMFQPCPLLEDIADTLEALFDRPLRLLDLGCGTGRDSLWASRRGWYCTAVDNIGWRLDLLRDVGAMHGLDVHTVTADVLKADGKEALQTLGQFDVVLCVRFFIREFLAEIPQLLSPGAVVVISHFRDGVQHSAVGRPKKLKFIVRTDELPTFFGLENGFEILRNELTVLAEDGRPIVNFAARKPKDGHANTVKRPQSTTLSDGDKTLHMRVCQ